MILITFKTNIRLNYFSPLSSLNKISNGNSNSQYLCLKNKLDNLSQFKNHLETPDEKQLYCETMSEKSSFLFTNNNNKPSPIIDDISNLITKNNPNYVTTSNNEIINNNNNSSKIKNIINNPNSNLKATSNNNNNIRQSAAQGNIKSLTRGGNLIKNIKKNQLSNSVSSKFNRSLSYGERLFYKATILEEKKDKKTEIYRKMKEAEFDKNCTFKPKINANSIALSVKANFSKLGTSSFAGNASRLPNNFSSPNIFNNNNNFNINNYNYNNKENFENNLYNSNIHFENLSNFNNCSSENYNVNYNNNNNNTNNNSNSNKIRYKNKQCTNHNQKLLNNTFNLNENEKANLTRVNSNSKILNKTCFKSPEEIELMTKRLHENAERYKKKKILLQESYYSQICPFSPEIISREEGEVANMDNFFNRLQNWVDKRNEKYEQDQEKRQFDERTGNRLFSPQINKSKKHNVFYL